MTLTLRALDTSEVSALTDLLHRAYAPLAARGLRYLASHQDEETTRRRIEGGSCIVAVDGAVIVGSITWHPPGPDGVATFQQFCVEPGYQRRGIATMLLDDAERRARAAGAKAFSCDTAEPATDLIAWYERRGYAVTGVADYRPVTNYPSVVLTKPL
ncbi:MAG: GNAT family N-acetyltransferase [Actinomycetota bacterium]